MRLRTTSARLAPLWLLVLLVVISGAAPVTANPYPLRPFVPEFAWSAELFSAAAYCSSTIVSNWSCPPCRAPSVADFQVTATILNSYEVSLFVGWWPSQNSAVVSFRGTSDLENWIEDLYAAKSTPFPGMIPGAKAHAGFTDDYLSVRANLTAALNSTLRAHGNSQNVLVTGHSLGAALAALCAIDLIITDPKLNVTVYNFGQPRVGNSVFVQQYENNLTSPFRIIHYDDIVPHLPPTILGFVHATYEVWFPEWNMPRFNATFELCVASGEDPACSDSVSSVDLGRYGIQSHLYYYNYFISGCPH